MKNINQIITEEINRYLTEDGEGAALGGTSTFSMTPSQNAGGYDAVAMGGKPMRKQKNIYTPTTKRSKDFSNGSMMMQQADDETDVNKKKK